ncbi:MAG: nucleotidyl transferase AbiEii/AbiGii toxin family protein (plasmid) [Candidatus Methanoperedens sp.]|nr:MAG: nucleotidyl transferase AbiEii/AbiGii toxin family protein [Candidatus Methanoperedens sp.]
MLKPDRKYYESLSEKTNFQKDILEKVFRLADLLRTIYDNEFLNGNFVLKGGTAINFLYFNMPRLSVDIDFNFVSGEQREDMLKSRENIDKILTKIFTINGYEIEKIKRYALLQYNLKYTNNAGNIDRIKIEINFMERIPVFEIAEKKISIFDIPEFKVRTYRLEELFATKLRALLTRSAPRDMFDIYILLKSGLKFDERALKKCFIFYFCLAQDFRMLDMESIGGIDSLEIKKFLLPLMEKGKRVDMDEILKKVNEFVSRLLELNENEQKFIECFYEQKNADLDLLFEDMRYNPQLKEHPMIEWRLKKM